jgi:hypothetical protein
VRARRCVAVPGALWLLASVQMPNRTVGGAMIEAAVSAPRDGKHTSPDRTWARRFEDVDGV